MLLTMYTDILAVISLDMYHGLLSSESLFDMYCEREDSSEYLIRKYDEGEYYFNHEAYRDVVGQCAWNALSGYFQGIADIVKIKLLKEFYIDSPDYYNFETDRLAFVIEIEPSEIEKIKSYVENVGQYFFSWIHERYCSQDGFISYMPYTKTSYLDALSSDVGALLSKAVSMFLMFEYESYIEEFGLRKDFYQSELIAEVWKHGGWDDYVYDNEYGVRVKDYYIFC